jgi:hypothetical protein
MQTRHVGRRHVVDWVVRLLFRQPYFPDVRFPLCFLLWLVPLPEFALNHIVNFLQQGSAYAARLLFVIAGVPVSQEGVRLTIPSPHYS